MELNSIICVGGNGVVSACIESDCNYCVLKCNYQNCVCQIKHMQCSMNVTWKILYQNIKTPKHKTNDIFQKFFNQIDKAFQTNLKLIQREYNQFKFFKERFGINECEIEFLQIIKSKKYQKLTPSVILRLQQEVSRRKNSTLISNKINQLESQIFQLESLITSFLHQLKNIYTNGLEIKFRQNQFPVPANLKDICVNLSDPTGKILQQRQLELELSTDYSLQEIVQFLSDENIIQVPLTVILLKHNGESCCLNMTKTLKQLKMNKNNQINLIIEKY